MRLERYTGGRIALDAEQEFRRDEHRLDRRLDAALEILRLRAPLLIERVQRLDIGARDRTPERAARKRSQNRSRARRLLRRSGRPADEHGAAARRVAAAAWIVRTADNQLADVRYRRPDVEALDAGAVQSQIDRGRQL